MEGGAASGRWKVVGAMMLGVVVVLAILAFAVARGPGGSPSATSAVPTTVPLQARSFPDLGFEVRAPRDWPHARRTVETGRVAVVFRDPSSGPSDAPRRAFDVIAERVSLAEALATVEATFLAAFADYRKQDVTDGVTVAGRAAFRHRFDAAGLRFDQWWVDAGDGTLRITFWAPPEDAAAGSLDREILDTLRVL